MIEQISASALRRRQQPETLRLRAIMPVLEVNDLETSLAWYRDVLGFVVGDVAEKNGRAVAVQLMAGKVRLLLVQDEHPYGPERVKGEGVRIICATRQDIDELAKIVVERGGVIEPASPHERPGHDFSVLDPDGFRISISSGARSRRQTAQA